MAHLQAPETVIRGWGYYEVLARTPALKFKKLVLMPGKSTSMQYHHHRDEFWTVLSGMGEALIGEEHYQLRPDLTVWVSAGIIHQLRNTGSQPLVIHEVQQGDYLEEDDIVRLPDSLACMAHMLPQSALQGLPKAA